MYHIWYCRGSLQHISVDEHTGKWTTDADLWIEMSCSWMNALLWPGPISTYSSCTIFVCILAHFVAHRCFLHVGHVYCCLHNKNLVVLTPTVVKFLCCHGYTCDAMWCVHDSRCLRDWTSYTAAAGNKLLQDKEELGQEGDRAKVFTIRKLQGDQHFLP